ncbi:caspase family protein [Marivita geojedonensis]|uniref:caspase family protein n=1 Tax=Marivita geojedonensis TaxID=1123756 RepID=UPI000D495226|nr:caspase family protein [Marivita geojedonensis]PRY72474.1 putative caspase-like protein [Marivita geojedonensis]
MTDWLSKLSIIPRLQSILTVLLCAAMATSASAQDRVALVIGNSSYTTVSPLDNPSRDAELIASTLQQIDFDVTLLIDASQIEMKRALSDFGRKLRDGGLETTGLFYYAGHGVQSFGNNYLLPVDVSLSDAADLDLEGVEAQSVLRQMASARNRTNFVILDACRNNPFADMAEFDAPGLAEMKAPTGTFLAYATSPGAVALDGTGQNSPFTTALAREMIKPGVPVEQMFKQVRVAVLDETRGMQTPWDTSSLTSNFTFVDAPQADPEALAARQLWESVQATKDPVQIMLFLRGYPDSEFAEEARALLAAAIEAELTNDTAAVQRPEPAGPAEDEQAMFEALQANPTLDGYRAFLDAFPNGTYSEFARGEVAALEAKTNVDPIGEGVPAVEPEPEAETELALVTEQERSTVPTVIEYDTPLALPGTVLDGVALSNITGLSPLFPPIEGLPEELWKNATCASCHEWNKERLCEQSNVYLTLSGQKNLEKPHPFNGALKRNLRQWAAGGCQ